MAINTWTDTRIINQLNSGSKWSSSLISYAFPTSSNNINTSSGESGGFQSLDAAQQYAAELAIFTWDDLIRQDFFKSTSRSTNIEYGMSDTGVEYAHAYYPITGSVWFNKTYNDLTNPTIGERGFEAYIHETGHALGMNHMGEYNGEGDWTASCYEDSTLYSVMSYFGPSEQAGEGEVAWADWVGADGTLYAPQTPMLNDVLAIQNMYGSEVTRAEDTAYGFNSNIYGNLAQIYNFRENANPILCLYDSGGIDTLDLSGWSTNSDVSLVAGTFSSCNSMTNNVSIARNVVIENATTGDGNDTLTGNNSSNLLNAGAGNDQLEGRQGDDTLIGGLGSDTAIYTNTANNYHFEFTNSTLQITDKTANRDGTDHLFEIESLTFGRGNWNIINETGTNELDVLRISENTSNYQINTDGHNATIINTANHDSGLMLCTGIERLQANDQMIALDVEIGQNAGAAYRLYQAAFDRIPDIVGLGYWISELDSGTSLISIASGFMGTDEFKRMYGNEPTDLTFLTLLYQHVFDREPDNAGFNYWQEILSSGTQRAQVLELFSESTENYANTESNLKSGILYQTWNNLLG